MAHFQELDTEYAELKRRIKDTQGVLPVFVPLEKGKVLVHLHVIAENKKRSAILVYDTEVYAWLNDEDLALCGDAIEKSMSGLHFKCKTGYIHNNYVEYFIKPDWDYWYGRKL